MGGLAVSDLADIYVTERAARQEITGATPTTFRSVLGLFARAIGDPPAERLNREIVVGWLTGQKVGPATIRIRLSTVRTFCDWLVDRAILEVNPCIGVKGPRQPRAVPRAVPSDAVARVLAEAPDSRARAIILLMVQEGLRACEVAALQTADVDELHRTIVVVGKGGHQRMLPPV